MQGTPPLSSGNMANDAISEHFATYAKARAKTPCTAQNRMGMEKSGNKHFLKRTNKKNTNRRLVFFN
ncbi:TPA: hypothetical protein ACFNMV_000131, partial [Neisseria lactamica]